MNSYVTVLQWTPSRCCGSVGSPARTCQQQLCSDTECSFEELSGAMDDRDGWRERESGEFRENSPT